MEPNEGLLVCTRFLKHVEWDVKLEKGDEKPGGDDVCWPKQQKGIYHVKYPIIHVKISYLP